uniref:Mediator of RNA polymerase II transcription subunit 19 n=1 Tax=Caenorhabditis japonica TaxID=281687 RepID=A0A8R1HSG6_CAEJA
MLEPGTSNAGGTTPGGSLRTKISLKSGTVVPPFHTFKLQLPPCSEVQGNHDLLTSYGLGPVDGGGIIGQRRVKEDMSAFLPHVIGRIEIQPEGDQSTLRKLIDKPPIHKEITHLSSSAMMGFKLSAGPVEERFTKIFAKRKEPNLAFGDKFNIVRHRPPYDAYGYEEDETEKGFPKKHKKKKKDKKRKKDKEAGDVDKKKKKGDERML